MQRVVLPFAKEQIEEDEIKEHIEWYYNKAQLGLELLWDNKKSESRKVLLSITNNLNEEKRYYQKEIVSKIMTDEAGLYNDYYHTIIEASSNINHSNSYDQLDSNLYGIQSDLTYYENFRNYVQILDEKL